MRHFAKTAILAIVISLLSALPALAGWQEEFKDGLGDIRSGRYSSGAEKAYVALQNNKVEKQERAQAMVTLINSLFQVDMDEVAAAIIDRAMRDDKDNEDVYFFCRGAMHERSWQFEPAIKAYEKAIDINADNVSSLLALSRLRLGCPEDQFVDQKQALKLAQRATKAAANSRSKTMSYLLVARVQATMGDFGKAVQSQQKAIEEAKGKLDETQLEQLKMVLQELKRRAALKK